jgi:hypothetical protein
LKFSNIAALSAKSGYGLGSIATFGVGGSFIGSVCRGFGLPVSGLDADDSDSFSHPPERFSRTRLILITYEI